MTIGVLYMTWGTEATKLVQRSRASLQKWHPELPVEHVVLEGDDPGDASTLLRKTQMNDRSPFDITLFLDADTVVFDRLDYGFEAARKFGLACCICECPWARRYPSHSGDAIEYNTGVLFWSRSLASPLFERWKQLGPGTDSSIEYHLPDRTVKKMPFNDQASFALAMQQTDTNPHVLPLNWNFRPQWYRHFFGRLKIWHANEKPWDFIESWNATQGPEVRVLRSATINTQ